MQDDTQSCFSRSAQREKKCVLNKKIKVTACIIQFFVVCCKKTVPLFPLLFFNFLLPLSSLLLHKGIYPSNKTCCCQLLFFLFFLGERILSGKVDNKKCCNTVLHFYPPPNKNTFFFRKSTLFLFPTKFFCLLPKFKKSEIPEQLSLFHCFFVKKLTGAMTLLCSDSKFCRSHKNVEK